MIHWWMLKLVGSNLRTNRIFAHHWSISSKLLITKVKTVALQGRNLADATLTKGLRLTRLVIRHIDIMCPLIQHTWKETSPLGYWCLTKIDNFNLIMRKHQRNSNGGTFYKASKQCSVKVSRSKQDKKDWKTVTDWRSLWDMTTKSNAGSWIESWTQ